MITNRLISFLLFTCFLLVGVAAYGDSGTAEKEKKSEASYRIDVGDILEINVWKEEELSKNVFVRLDGRISLPLIGDVTAAGKTPVELSQALEEKISEFIEEPTVTVLMAATNSRVYYMVGNINNPGAFHMNTPVNLLQAIAKAGGLGEWADRDDIIIVRRSSGKDEILSFDYDKFVKGKDLSQNIMLHYGDTVIIP
jgi:polysaccharide export outer membrane protein